MSQPTFQRSWPFALLAIIFVSSLVLGIQQLFGSHYDTKIEYVGEETPTSTAPISTPTATIAVSELTSTTSVPMDVQPAEKKVSLSSVDAKYRISTIKVGNESVRVLIADTPDLRYTGLSNRKNLGDYGGMLFLFEERGDYTFVMRDMLFPLDFIFIDGTTVTKVIENAPPETGAGIIAYRSDTPVTAVLEAPAGFAMRAQVKAGDTVFLGP